MMISRTLDKKLDRSIRELKHIFTRALDKHEANFQSRGIMEECRCIQETSEV